MDFIERVVQASHGHIAYADFFNAALQDHDATLSPADALRTAESSPAIPPPDMSAPRRCPDPAKAGAAS